MDAIFLSINIAYEFSLHSYLSAGELLLISTGSSPAFILHLTQLSKHTGYLILNTY
jgi:hypothetical protein